MPTRPNSRTYSPAEEATLAALYPSAPRADVLAALPGRTWHSVQIKACQLDIPRVLQWPPEAVAVLRAHYPAHGAAYVARLLGKDPEDITKKASNMHIGRAYAPKPAPRKPAVLTYRAPVRPVPARILSARTPVLNAAITRKRLAGRPVVAITAAEVSKLEYNHPGRMAYLKDGARGFASWQHSIANTPTA